MNFDDAITLAKSRSDCASNNVDTIVHAVMQLKPVHGDIVECGSYRCGMTIAMAASDPTKIVWAFDLFGGLPYGEGVGFENFGANDFSEIRKAVRPFSNISLMPGKHEETVPPFPDRRTSFLFMDSDHYSSHVVCLKKFWPLLEPSGMAVFHDWSFVGVQNAIRETIPENQIFDKGVFPDSPNMGFIVKA